MFPTWKAIAVGTIPPTLYQPSIPNGSKLALGLRISRDDTSLTNIRSRLISSNVIEVIQRLELHILAKDVCPEPPWKDLENLVPHMNPSGHSEDVIQFFQCALFGLRDP